MPDDERLGGTPDPHEYGRRHRREDAVPDGEKPRRRRRSMEASGGLSVADLVQKHTASRTDLTPVEPQHLQQNTLMSGRRAKQDRQNADGPAGRSHPGEPPRRQAPAPPSIADALGDNAPEFPRADAPRPGRRAARNGFPPDDTPRRTRRAGTPHPGEAARNGRRAAETPGDAVRNTHHAAEPPDAFLPDTPGEGSGPRRRAGAAPAPHPATRNSHHAGEPPREATGHHAFPADAPGEGSGPRRRAAQHPGDASGHHAFPDAPVEGSRRRAGEGSAFLPGAAHPAEAARNGRRAGSPPEAPAFPPAAPHPGRRPGEAPGFLADAPGEAPGPRRAASDAPGFPPDAPYPGDVRSGRRPGAPVDAAGEAPGFPPDAPHPGDPRTSRRPGEASAHHAIPGEPPPLPGKAPTPRPRRGTRRAGEASAHHAVPGPGDPRTGQASAHHAIPGAPGFPPDGPRNGRRPGEASIHLPVPGDPPFPRDDAPLNGRRPGETSAHHPIPGEPPAFPRDDAPLNGRRPGETSAHHPVPGRQGPPTPPPGQWPGEPLSEPLSEPRLPPAAIDAPDSRPRTTGVPPVPPPLPPRGDDDLVSMTTEMEAIGEEVQKRRSIDHTLARFSAVHDEIKAEEREKKAKRRKLMPWQNDDDEMDHLDELEAQQSMAMRIPVVPAEDEPEPEEDEPPSRRKKKNLLDRLRGRSAGKAFVVFFAALVFVGTAAGWGFKSYVEAGAQTVDALDPDSKAIQDADAQLGDENFLLVGSDTRAGAAAEEGVGDEKEVQGARSDTVMIAHIPKNRERVVVVSFPRDLEVNRPACEGWDAKSGELTGEQHPPAEQVKINTAYQIGGPKCVTKMVQELSGLAINHFVGIDFHGFKDMVDAVQGVEVCVERPMKDDVLGTIVPEAGKNVKLTGDQALNFVRARHVEGDITSDYGRIIRQQRFLSSLLRKAMSSEVLLNPGKLTDFVDAFSKATFGDNVGVDQLFTLGQSMQGVEAGRVTFITVPTVGEANERGNEDLLVDDTNALFEAIRQDAPLPGETPKKTVDDASQQAAQLSGLRQDQPQGSVDPRTIKIQVLNGGNETGGIAADTADALAEHGFQIMRVDAAPEDIDKPAIIRYSKERAAAAQTLQAAVPGSQLVEDPSMAGAIMLVIGPGFDGDVTAPTGGGKTVEVPENLQTVNAGDVSCA